MKAVEAVMNAVLEELVQAERAIHGPSCEGHEAMRELLEFYRDRVIKRLKEGIPPTKRHKWHNRHKTMSLSDESA
ncbi:MAG TPA: hypothetical protein VNO22_10285 [Planctomycetota bacterium]|nr:hypothetical protein [Planctomycetota bacterium]